VKQILRTPEVRFLHLVGYPYRPHYLDNLQGFDGMRMHYVDEGARGAEVTFLCLHGEPTWSYLYRKMIPVFTAAGHRAVAPDLFGFGRSDKPEEDALYSFHFHRNALIAFIERLDLRNIALVCQDWGGLLGLTLPMEMPERFSRLLVMNTTLGTGDVQLSEGFLAWRTWAASHPDMDVGALLERACPHLTIEERLAYVAPFPDERYKAGVRRFPELAPDRLEDPGAQTSRKAREWLKTQWAGESFMAIGMRDPVLGPRVMHGLKKVIRGCPPPLEVPEAGHFVPEWGTPIALKALQSFGLSGPGR
jgi:pimeloyl-ACP methyl ester carboxylesterase